MNPPPPPPPHGTSNGNRNGLPEGNYDIFIIPPHSSGGGFLYLPSLQPHRNSFLAGVASALLVMMIWVIVLPVLKEWFHAIAAGGGFSVIILMMAVGVGCWAFGKTQAEAARPSHEGPGGASTANPSGGPGGPQPHYAPPPDPKPPPKPTWQRSANTGAANGTANAKTGWEKAREETKKREEERRKAEELRKKKEDDERERVRQREKDAREREARERREKERARPASPNKGHRHPTAKTATDDDAYSYRPYDKPKRPAYQATASSVYSESSYAPSQSTSRTTPPPSHRGPYRSKDPDKIVLKAVYLFSNNSAKDSLARLVSGLGSITDGLILRITTEGLFIDDDVRGVPQREWDVKAWTMKSIEVRYPRVHALGASSGSDHASYLTAFGPISRVFAKKRVRK
ncbi:hypothetical protein MMC21_002175 [Puttea exsequens]|nr:hypothetical protein [Puttea exsequens]